MQTVNTTEKNKRSISKIFSPVLSALFPAVASMLNNQSITHRFSIKEQARFFLQCVCLFTSCSENSTQLKRNSLHKAHSKIKLQLEENGSTNYVFELKL